MSEAVATVKREIPAKVFSLAIASTENEMRYALNSVALLPDGRIAATDGHWLAVIGPEIAGPSIFNSPRLIDAETARLLARATGPVTVNDDGTLAATVGTASIRASLKEGEFPNIDRPISMVQPKERSLWLNPIILGSLSAMCLKLGAQSLRFDFPSDKHGIVKVVGLKLGIQVVEILLMPMTSGADA